MRGRLLQEPLEGRVVPECQKDLVKKESKSHFHTGKAVAILGTFRFFSDFGSKITTAAKPPQPKLLSDASCRLLRFYYKCCELRKATDKSRVRWHRCWKKKRVREAFNESVPHEVCEPFFKKRR